MIRSARRAHNKQVHFKAEKLRRADFKRFRATGELPQKARPEAVFAEQARLGRLRADAALLVAQEAISLYQINGNPAHRMTLLADRTEAAVSQLAAALSYATAKELDPASAKEIAEELHRTVLDVKIQKDEPRMVRVDGILESHYVQRGTYGEQLLRARRQVEKLEPFLP